MTATLITQSSSAGVAATLTMVYTGAINFEQAAALVTGMDVGTTFTAAMAAIGGSTEVKRTGFSHVFYNFFTGIGALLLITPYTMFWEWFSPEFLTNQAEIAIVTFHTLFNVIGVILILPFTKQFAHMMEKIVPPSKQLYKQNFDLDLLEEIPLALTVVQKSLEDEFKILIKHLLFLVGDTKHGQKANLSALETVLDNTQDFIDKINIKENRNTNWERLIDLIHIMDHLQRLFDRCEEDEKKAIFLRTSHTFKLQKEAFIHTLQNLLLLLDAQVYTKISDTAKHMEQAVTDFTIQEREKITSLMANGTISIQEGTSHLEVIRWMQRTSTHIARISFHIEEATLNAGK